MLFPRDNEIIYNELMTSRVDRYLHTLRGELTFYEHLPFECFTCSFDMRAFTL